MTKKIYLFLFFCVLFANQVLAQSGTYTANGVTWKYEINGTEATITGETVGRDNFTGALNIPDEVIVGSTHYPVTGIGMSAFGGYLKATSVQIPESITEIGAFAFQNVNINGPLLLPHVIRIGTYAFYEAKGITGPLSLPELIEIGQDAFYHTGITSLSLPKVVTVGAGAFSNCYDLSGSVSLPEAKIIGSAALGGTPKLTGTLSLPKVEKIESYALNGAGFTGDFIFPASLKEVGDYALVAPFRSITFEPGTALTSLGSGVFAYNQNLNYLDLTNVVLPAGLSIARTTNGSPFTSLWNYTIVYLPSTSPAAEPGEENFVIGNHCDNFVVYDEGYALKPYDCTIKHSFTADKATYKRNIGSNGYKTLCLPYPATLPNDMRAYELRSKTGDGKRFRFVSIGDGGTSLEANKPYLIRNLDNSMYKYFGTDVNVQVPHTPTTIEVPAAADGTIFFGGTMAPIDNATAAGMNTYNLEGYMWKPIRTDNPNGYVHSFRCYIRSTTPIPAGAKGFAIVIDNEGETTGIETAEQDLEQGQGRIYTLDGRFVGTDMDALKSGEVYVKNGRKFYKF